MKHKTPISELAETLGIDIGAMNQADRQDKVCKAAQARIKELEARLIRKDELPKEARRLAEQYKERLHCINKLKSHGL